MGSVPRQTEGIPWPGRGKATISGQVISPLLAALSWHGVAPGDVLRGFGVDPAVAEEPEARIPLVLLDAIWQRAAEVTGDECIGLRAARAVSADSFGILSYLGVTSPTLGEAIRRVTTYFRLLSDASEYRLEVRGRNARLTAHQYVLGRAPVRQRAEFTIGALFRYCHDFLDGKLAACEVFLEHPAPRVTGAHRRFFGLAPRFRAGETGFAFPADRLQFPLRTGDAALSGILEQLAQRLLRDRPSRDTTAARLTAILIRGGARDQPSLAQSARTLGMSGRTLQRRLREEGTNHRAVLEEARRQIACQLVSQSGAGLSEVAFALGFSDPAPFHRAFKRWTGTTPAQFRQTHRSLHPH